MLLMPLYFNML